MEALFHIDRPEGPRSYLVHAPSGRTGPLPLVVFLHGAGGTAAWTLDETGWGRTADAEGFLLVLPEGTRPHPDRPPDFLHNPQVWNDGAQRGRAGPVPVDDVAFLNGVLDDVAQRFPVDPSRVFVTGFSNGAGMTFRLGTELSERLTALAPVAGYCALRDPRPARPLPTLYVVGDQDPLVPVAGGEVVSPWTGKRQHRPPVADTLRTWARALGCPTEPALADEGDGVRVARYGPGAGGVELWAYTVAGLGHHWPGGRGQLSRRLAGPPSQRVDGNRLIWDFFRRCGPSGP